MSGRYLTDEERWPLLSPAGRARLDALRQHPSAPLFNYAAGERLGPEGLARVRAFEAALATAPRGWRPGEVPGWVPAFVTRVLRDVPFHRRRAPRADDFFALPTCDRADLAREPWAFVPDAASLDDLLGYPTSGTTGHPVTVPSHPEMVAAYVPLMRRALARHGVSLDADPARVAIALVAHQGRTYTFASVVSLLGEAGYLKLNLNPADWRDPDDRARYLDACDPQVYTGDPLSFRALAELPSTRRPKALVSTSMTLLPGWRDALEARFGCPVIDVYSLHEAGPVAVATPRGHELLPHDLFVEVLRPDGTPCAPGERGEITLTGGRNPSLPLLRYRTGDQARLALDGPDVWLVDFEGRPPTLFRATDGRAVNNIDVTWALRPLALSRFALHQRADGAFVFRVHDGEAAPEAVLAALRGVFGADAAVSFEPLPTGAGKVVQYTSET